LQSEESAAKKTDAALHARLAASQHQDASDVKTKDAQLANQKENAEHLNDMLKEKDDLAKNSASALVVVLLVAAVAFRVTYKKHKALIAALGDLDSSKAQHSQFQQPLLQVEEVPVKLERGS